MGIWILHGSFAHCRRGFGLRLRGAAEAPRASTPRAALCAVPFQQAAHCGIHTRILCHRGRAECYPRSVGIKTLLCYGKAAVFAAVFAAVCSRSECRIGK